MNTIEWEIPESLRPFIIEASPPESSDELIAPEEACPTAQCLASHDLQLDRIPAAHRLASNPAGNLSFLDLGRRGVCWPRNRSCSIVRRVQSTVSRQARQTKSSPPCVHRAKPSHDGPLSARAGSGNPTVQMQLRRQPQARMPLFAAQGACGRLVQCTACLTIFYLRRSEHKVH